MRTTLDVLNSTLTSTLRLWRGTNARASLRQPAKPLHLYEFEACPYCRLVREALTELDLDALIHPTPHGGQRFRPQAERLGGRQQFPFLVDPNTGESMYESADIIDYLYRRYAGRPAPTRLLRPLDVSSSMLASIPRLRAGAQARPSKAPKRPLELFSFESSPYSRRVRELLCELEIPYLLRSTGKAQWQDLGPPILRATLFPTLPVAGRTRVELLKRAGKVQVPYLVDPNTGTAMFESDVIRNYLLDTYAKQPSGERHGLRRRQRTRHVLRGPR
jgi:glutathione S-transferase